MAAESGVAAIAERAVCRLHIPRATYRLQFHAGFTFRDALAVLDYLDQLGVSHVYASPLFAAREGSTHGYDVVDPTRLNPALGTQEDFDALAEGLRARDMGLILDIVPNHMGINDAGNAWWLDVLENGRSSQFALFFDIQWQPPKPELAERVLLPVLGDQSGAVLEAGQLRLVYAGGGFHFDYYGSRFPVAPGTYIEILGPCLELMRERAAPANPDAAVVAGANGLDTLPSEQDALVELESIRTAAGYLPGRTEDDPDRLAERQREKEVVKRRLAHLYQGSEFFRMALDETVRRLNGETGDPASFDALDALLERQAHRLAFWRVAGEEINYRRFFDINDLAAIRVEDPRVFDAVHGLALRLLLEGKADGLRIDHPDGLYDPPGYFRRIQQQYLLAVARQESEGDGAIEPAEVDAWLANRPTEDTGEKHPWPVYVVAEKILSEEEPLPPDWAVYGTTGYDFLASVNNVFVARGNERAFDRIYRRFTGLTGNMVELSQSTKMLIMRDSLASEIHALSYELERLSERNRHFRDFTLNGLRTALRAVVASLAVYRTYIDPHTGIISDRDRAFVEAAVRDAKVRLPGVDESVFDYVRDTWLLRNHDAFRAEDRGRLASWLMWFQQMTGPVMAKGVEDTAFYRFNRLVSLNEVGGHPAQFGALLEQFHGDNKRRSQHWPHAMLATSTHDNKRSEDVRARLNVLSELPDPWRRALVRWSRLNQPRKVELDWGAAPDRNAEYLLYQTLLGVWPLGDGSVDPAWGILRPPVASPEHDEFVERIETYMAKATKEAKVHTSWINPHEGYDVALRRFIAILLKPVTRNRFLPAFAPLARLVAYHGQFNALSQTLLKLTAPGVPDIYQGNEVWDFSLVDPDNRRPVDYALRRSLLEAAEWDPQRLLAGARGNAKLFVTQALLNHRRGHAELFARGAYEPLTAKGEKATHVIAFQRERADDALIVVAPRFTCTFAAGAELPPTGGDLWRETWLPLPGGAAGRPLHNLFTGETLTPVQRNGAPVLAVAEILSAFPLAALAPG